MIKSSFAELNIAIRGLSVAQSNIQVNSHNISNAAIDGYSRQYTKQQATKPFATGRDGMWGTGADITAVLQYRSVFLDTQFRNKSSVLGQFGIKNQQLSITEVTFSALGEAGLTTKIDDIFNTLEDLSTNPESLTTRNNFTTSLKTFTEQIGTIGRQLQDQQTSLNQEVKSVVDTINSLGKQIAGINQQIKLSELNGAHANDLRDQRNRLLDELSKYANIKVTEHQKNKEYDERDITSGPSNIDLVVQINGYNFVNGNDVNELECVQRDNSNRINEMDVAGLYDIRFKNSGLEFDIYSSTLTGELKGLIDLRDGNNNYQTLVYDPFLDRAVLAGSETPMPDSTDTTKYPLGDADPQFLKDMETYSGLKISNYKDEAAFLSAVRSGKIGKNGTQLLDSNSYKGVPHYMNKLNNFIRAFSLSMNEGQTFDTSLGYGKLAEKVNLTGTSGHINSYDIEGNLGQLLFTYQNGGVYQTEGAITDYTEINFNNFYVNPNVLNNPKLVACALSEESVPGDARAVAELIALKNDTSIFKEGTYQDYLIAMAGELGIAKKQAESFELSYTEVVAQTDSQRMSVYGVDLNEETVSLTKNQQIYTAAAKLVGILNSMYTTCIDLGR